MRMKLNNYTLILGFLCFSLSSTQFANGQNFELEDRLMECLDIASSNKDFPFSSYLVKYEQLLIDEGVLAGPNGSDYSNVLKKLFDPSRDLRADIPTPSISFLVFAEDALKDSVGAKSNCAPNLMEGPEYESSNLAKLNEVTNKYNRAKDLQVSEFHKELSVFLTPEAFEHSYYKFTFFVMLNTIYYAYDTGIAQKLPPVRDLEDPPILTPEQILQIEIDADNNLTVEGMPAKVEELRAIAKAHLEDLKEEAVISLANARDTSYKFYVSVQNEIVAAYQEVRDEYALKRYGKPLEALSEEELKAVKLVYPQRFSEARPKD